MNCVELPEESISSKVLPDVTESSITSSRDDRPLINSFEGSSELKEVTASMDLGARGYS